MAKVDELQKTILESWGSISSDDPKYQKALNYNMTPIKVNTENLTAVMPSSKKQQTYNTSLTKCNCGSFIADKKPCKHMLRLAMELNIIKAPFLAYTLTSQGYTWKEVIDIVDKLPLNVQLDFLYHLKQTKSKKQPYRKKKEASLEKLIQDNLLIEFPEQETAKYKTVIMPWDFFRDYRKVHWYYSRKLYSHTEDEVDGIECFEASVIPNDEVTRYLLARGFLKGCRIGD